MLLSPSQCSLLGLEPFGSRQYHGPTFQIDKILLTLNAIIQEIADSPCQCCRGRDQIAIHRPVVVPAQGHAIAGIVVSADGEGHEVGGLDQNQVVQDDAESACCAAIVIDAKDDPAKRLIADLVIGTIGTPCCINSVTLIQSGLSAIFALL